MASRTAKWAALLCIVAGTLAQSTDSIVGLSPNAVVMNMAQESVEFSNFTEENLANYLRRGPDPYFAPTVPAMYLVAATEDDVVAGVQYALNHNLKLSFRGGGHHQAGVAFYPGGLTIDMGALKDIHVDPVTGVARFQAGLQGLELADVVSQYGLHYRIGHATSNGIAGFTLGGGAGWGGLAIDQIVAMDVVSTWLYPDQELSIVKVDLESYPDLFSALQGAGQMTGVVVAFYAELQQLPPDNIIRVVEAVWPLAAASEAWQLWDSYNSSHYLDPIVETSNVYVTIPGLGPALLVGLWDWSPDNRTGTQDFIDGFVAEATAAGAMVIDMPTPYMDVIGAFNATQQYPGVTHYSQSVIVSEMTPDIIAILDAGYANATTPLSIIINDYQDLSGKANEDTAWGWKGTHNIYIWGFWTRTEGGAEVDGDAEHIAWVEGIAAQLQPYKLGQYINFISFSEATATEQCFSPANWPAVVAAKQRYDPHNLLRELGFYHSGPGGTGGLDAANPSTA